MKKEKVRLIAVFLVIVLIINLVLFGLGKIKNLWFWMIIVIVALMAYKGLPYLKKK